MNNIALDPSTPRPLDPIANDPIIVVDDLTMAFGDNVVQRDLTFTINRGDVFIVMGGSGCGKSTLMKNLIGLQRPSKGKVYYNDKSFWDVEESERQKILRRLGVMYQGGALWSSMTLAENITLIIQEYQEIGADQARACLFEACLGRACGIRRLLSFRDKWWNEKKSKYCPGNGIRSGNTFS